MKCKDMTGDLRLLQLYSETKLGTKTGSSRVMCNDECTKALTHSQIPYSTIFIQQYTLISLHFRLMFIFLYSSCFTFVHLFTRFKISLSPFI